MTLWLFTFWGPKIKIYDKDLGVVLLQSPFAVLFYFIFWCHQQDDFTIQHHYGLDIFYVTINSQLQKINYHFNEHLLELLILNSVIDPWQSMT